MNNTCLGIRRARMKRASLAILLLVAADPTRAAASQAFLRPGSGLATPVRISPDRPGWFRIARVLHQPHLNRFVCFYFEMTAAADIVWSRQLDARGKPAGGPQKIWETGSRQIEALEAAYNELDDRFFLVVGCGHDSVTGILTDRAGRTIPGGPAVVIKPKTRMGSAYYPRAAWLPGVNRYAVGWSSSHASHPDSPELNGQNFAVLDRALGTVRAPRRIRSQPMKSGPFEVTTLLVVEDLLLWGTAEEGPLANRRRPIVWFTDFDGRVKTSLSPGTQGLFRPGNYGRGWNHPDSVLDAADGRILIQWDSEGESDTSSGQGRIMSTGGQFLTTVFKFPKSAPEAVGGTAVFAAGSGRFFRVDAEYAFIFKGDRFYQGGRMYGLFVRPDGAFVDRAGKLVTKATPLTAPLPGPKRSFFPGSVAYDSRNNDCLAAYMIYDYTGSPAVLEIWGVVY